MKLSKSQYLVYLDAPRHLWAYVNNKLDSKELDTFTKQLFEQGYEVQKYAHDYVTNYLIPKEYTNTTEFAFEVTKDDGQFEVRIDLIIQNPTTQKWDIYEIKSTNSVKTLHKKDLTFQYLVLQKHYDIGQCYILHLNNEYVREGEIDLSQLFASTDITQDVQKLAEIVNQERFDALETVKHPDYKETLACIKPKLCPCIELCHPDLPKYSIYQIARISGQKEKVRNLEINYSKDIHDVPGDGVLGKYALSPTQRLQVNVAQSGQPVIDIADIQLALEKLVYPLYFIDYESFNPAIPMYDKYKPYDQMPFQYSLHIQESPDAPYTHKEFIETMPVDPSVGLLEALKRDIGDKGSVIIWSKFERTQNNAMKRRYPVYEALMDNVNERLWDLMDIFQKMMYVHPDFRGSYSIKKVLPVLVPELSYKGMAIADGSMAMTKWVQMVYGGGITATEFSELSDGGCGEDGGCGVSCGLSGEPVDIPKIVVDKEETRENLLRYCELDTWAMVKILEVVRGEASFK